MSKLCLSTYLNVLKLYENPYNSGTKKILNALVYSICRQEQDIPDYEVSKIKRGQKNISGHVMDKILSNITNSLYPEYAKRELYPLLNSNKLNDISKVLAIIIQEDDSIKDDDTIDDVSQTRKNELSNIQSDFDFIIGVFLFILKWTKNNHTEEYASEITEDFCKKAIEKYNSTKVSNSKENLEYNINMDSDIPSQAKAFCRKYEESRELLTLCQIANIINPTHNHVNKMYSDYCECSDELKRQIMKEIDCPMIKADDENMLYNLLYRFSDDMEKMGLASSDKVYMFPQYVVKTLLYEEMEAENPDPTIFPIVPNHYFPDHTTSMLSQFIKDYRDYKGTDNELPVPFDWMWVNFDFSSCDEGNLILWLNIFIINCCYFINVPNDDAQMKWDKLVMPNISDTRTIEDIHFLALLMLYNTYMCK